TRFGRFGPLDAGAGSCDSSFADVFFDVFPRESKARTQGRGRVLRINRRLHRRLFDDPVEQVKIHHRAAGLAAEKRRFGEMLERLGREMSTKRLLEYDA